MIDNILFPVDFSPSCIGMAPFVKKAAALFGSRVTLLNVCDPASQNGFELYVRSPQEIAEEHWEIARNKLDSFLSSEFPVSACPRVVRSGDAAEQIADFAKTSLIDLIIMPTHAGVFRQMLLGSTVAKVLNDTDCPIMTAEHGELIQPKPLQHREWICAVPLNGNCKRVLNLATRAAAACGARLSLIHVLEGSHSGAGSGAGRQHHEEQQAFDRLTEIKNSIGCGEPLRILRGPAKEVLLNAVRESSADVLIVGRPPLSATGRLSDFAYGVVRDSPLPVISV
jgi:nucleotide-binding universal stress UspA family protein